MKKSWLNSLQVKIIAWSFVPAVIILAGVAWFTFDTNQKVIVETALKQDQAIVQEKAGQIATSVFGFIDATLVPVLMEIDNLHEGPLEVRAQNILDKAQGLEAFDGGIFFVDQEGIVFKTQPEESELLGQDWSDTLHFRAILEQPNIAASTELISLESSGKKIICMAAAMLGQKYEAVGAAYYCFTIYPVTQNAYYTGLNDLDLGANLYMVDRNFQIIYSSDPTKMGQEFSGRAYLQQLLQEDRKSGRFRDGREEMVVSYIPMAGTQSDQLGWIVLKQQSWKEIMRSYLPSLQLLIYLLALGVIVPAGMTAYGVRHITNPIQKLIQATKQVTAGQFKHHIEVKTGDEIEALADQFNLMSAKLDDSYSSLEKKVADRTRELAVMNSIISVASHSLDLQEILEAALDQTVEQMGFDAGAAFRLDLDPGSTNLVSWKGFEPAVAIDLMSSQASTRQEDATGQPPQVTMLEIKAPQVERQAAQVAHLEISLLVRVPLLAKGRTLGLFLLARRIAGQLSMEELSLLSAIGQQVGVAMENARLYEQAEQAAIAAERHRLARELHDAVTQTLFSANLIADVIPRIWERSPEEGLQNLEELRQLTRGALAEMRTMLLEMRPESLERAEIQSLLSQLADAFIGRVRVPVSLAIVGDCKPAQDVKLVFYRVAQEALNNIAKHSGARKVDLRFESQTGQMNLCIQDDGLGFEPGSVPPGHMGIAIMRERASSIGARLKVESQPGLGTTVELAWKPEWKDGSDGYTSENPGDVG